MRRFLLTIQYLGTNYAGWQRQINALSIQEVFENAVTRLAGRETAVHAAGRTDAGVHARAQMAHLDLDLDITPFGLVRGLNQHLPDDIRVVDASIVDPSFHARYEAKGKVYVYRILNQEAPDVFLLPTHAWIDRPLDLDVMSAALPACVGTHDFKAFTVANPQTSDTVRTIESADLERTENQILLTFRGNGFVRFQIRRIVGALLEAGIGKLGTDAVSRSLEPELAECRWSAPAKGLTLEQVLYD